MQDQKQFYKSALIFVLILFAFSAFSFWPGTTGDFVIDDIHNINPIGKQGGVKDLDTFRHFVFSGISGPTGRPVSLASFLLDAQNWPAEAYSFKRTNIFIHAFNATLIFFVILKLFQILGRTDSSTLSIAFIGSLIWLVHPLHVSTVLYVIQRMTELVALFSLAGIWCYLHGRQRLARSPGAGYLWMSSGVVLFGLLAIFSKENGVLLPLYIVIIEFTLLRQIARPPHWRYWAVPILGAPVALLLIYLGYTTLNHASSYANRDFDLYQRLLTEPRVLLDYISRIFLPARFPTLNHDDYINSTGLLTPATTLLSIIVLLATFIAAIIFNKRYSMLSFAVLWFLGGHLLESSVLSLEIYFEHRSYLPMLGFILAAAFYAEKYFAKNKAIIIAGVALVICTETLVTRNYSTVWGDHGKLINTWAEKQPDSKRAQMLYSLRPLIDADLDEILARVSKLHEKFPNDLGIEMLDVNFNCLANKMTPEDFLTLLDRAKSKPYDRTTESGVKLLLVNVTKEYCKQLTEEDLLALINALQSNNSVAPDKNKEAWLHLMKSNTLLSLNQIGPALKELDESFKIKPSIDIAIQQARILYRADLFEPAIVQLNKAEAVDRLRPRLIPSRVNEIDKARAIIEEKMQP